MPTLKTLPVAGVALLMVGANLPVRAADGDKLKTFSAMGKEQQLLPAGRRPNSSIIRGPVASPICGSAGVSRITG